MSGNKRDEADLHTKMCKKIAQLTKVNEMLRWKILLKPKVYGVSERETNIPYFALTVAPCILILAYFYV